MRVASKPWLGAVLVTIALGGFSKAQSPPEVFHGSTLQHTWGANILVSATMRHFGGELMRIRANSSTARKFMSRELPPTPFDKPYDFTLSVGDPLTDRDDCSTTFEGPKIYEKCFASLQAREFQPGLDFVTLRIEPTGIPATPMHATILMRTQAEPRIYARCYLNFLKDQKPVISICDLGFTQGGQWHKLETNAVALSNIQLFRCAALELRNAVWPDAPKFECQGP